MTADRHKSLATVGGGETLPSLLQRAGRRLLDAQTSGEVLEAKELAELALHLAKVMQAANETHADCLRIITRAESRMADEADTIDKNRGGRPSKTSPVSGAVSSTPTLKELGIDDRRLSEWRDVRDAGQEVVEEAIQEALAEGRAPTKDRYHQEGSRHPRHWRQ